MTGAGSGMGLECASRLSEMVDVLLLADQNERTVTDVASRLSDRHQRAVVEPFPVDITDETALANLASKVSDLGALRAVAHAAGISPTMADWRRILTVNLVGSAMLTDLLLPLARTGTSIVCFASLAPLLGGADVDPTIDAALDDPLHKDFLDRIHDAVGSNIEDSGMASIDLYSVKPCDSVGKAPGFVRSHRASSTLRWVGKSRQLARPTRCSWAGRHSADRAVPTKWQP